ncbi:hypothetical protein [Enterococcus gallinarum]|uniref:hypothetical protein n=1 Tax=Enterococcus gallinarum TaxID=1353 RepID=UPI001CAA80BB|nr:hypothetical protein [Enterococcus gallinarum]
MNTLIYMDSNNFSATIKDFWIVSSLQELDALPKNADKIILLNFSFLAHSRDLSYILDDTSKTILAVAFNDSIFDCLDFEHHFQTIEEVY